MDLDKIPDMLIWLVVSGFVSRAFAKNEAKNAKKQFLQEMGIIEEKRSGKNIFVVAFEDAEYDAEQVEEVLLEIGNPYKIYRKVQEGILNLPKEPCVYVLDDKLDQSSGLLVFNEIIKKNKHNFVILNTGIQNDTLLGEYVRMGVKGYVYKDNVDHKKNLKQAITRGILEIANPKE